MKLQEAQAIAGILVNQMQSFCHRAEIAGSIRRRKTEGIKDIEIVAIPRWEERPDPTDLFQERKINVNLLHEWAESSQCPVQWIKQGQPGAVPWKVKADGRYWRGLVVALDTIDIQQPVKLDLFLTMPENFGAIYLQRTGSSDFSYAVAAHAKYLGKPFVDGFLTVEGEPFATPDEFDVFDELGLRWVAPEKRNGWSDVASRPLYGRDQRILCAREEASLERFIWKPGDIEIISP